MNYRIFTLSFAAALLIASCIDRRPSPMYTEYKPVLMERESLERSISLHTAGEIESPAKIFYKDNYILISERYKGVHLIDNTDPSKPVNKGYIQVPGCIDMAMKNNTLYVDNSVDLVAIDISNIANAQINVTSRIKQAFPELTPPDGFEIPSKYLSPSRPQNTVIISWEK